MILILKFSYINHYKTCWDIVWSAKNYKKCRFKSIKNKKGKTMLSSKWAVCSSKKSRFLKEQEAKGILSNLETKIPLSNIPLLDKILF